LVVDGIRHVAARAAISSLVAPGCFGVAFVEVDESLRLSRLVTRGLAGDVVPGEEIFDELETLRREADIIVDGTRSDAANKIISWIDSASTEDG